MKKFIVLVSLFVAFLLVGMLTERTDAASGPSISGVGLSSNTVYNMIINFSGSGTFTNFNTNQFTGSPLSIKPLVLLTNPIVRVGTITGDGSGLTNLAVLTTNSFFINNVTNNNLSVTNIANFNIVNVTNTLIVSGNARFTSNAYFLNLNFLTNAAGTLTIAAGQVAQALQTNNNIAFTGFSGLDGTNAQPFTLLITNTAGSSAVKFYQFPAGTIMLSAPFTNGVYNTNQGVFSGWIYPGFGTNGTWTGN